MVRPCKEQELHHLQAEATALLQLDELDATTKPCDALPQRSTFQPDAEPLMEKEESLTNALYQCRRSFGHERLLLFQVAEKQVIDIPGPNHRPVVHFFVSYVLHGTGTCRSRWYLD